MNSHPDKWTFITNHAVVLTTIAQMENLTSREIAIKVGLTERTVIKIINDLVKDGYVTKQKEGRKNIYQLDRNQPLRKKGFNEVNIDEFLKLFLENES